VDVAAIRKALGKATPGPWSAADEHGDWEESKPAWCVSRMTESGEYVTDVAYIPQDHAIPEGQPCPQEQADAELIALLRNNAEALLNVYAMWKSQRA
jgi:hypothetical protein